jgi:hypothetical protein
MSFASRGSVRREWLRSRQTRIGTTQLMVCLSLTCHYLEERPLCEVFRLGELRVVQVEGTLLVGIN